MSPPFSRHRRWNNYVGDLEVDAERKRPKTLNDLLAAVREAVAAGDKIRAVGSGHSASRVAQPEENGRFVELTELRMPEQGDEELLGWSCYRAGVDHRHLVRVRAGITIEELNDALAAKQLALFNMGSYDGQTLAGVVSTATHGSGLRHSPLCDGVRAVEMVVDHDIDGQRLQCCVRVEPKTDGVTDADRYEAIQSALAPRDRVPLIQDDELFFSCVVGFGCFGIVYALTIEVTDAFWLQEHREVTTWTALKPHLVSKARANEEFFDVTIFPHALSLADQEIPKTMRGEHLCLATVRKRPLVHPDGPGPIRRDPDWFLLHLAASVFGTDFLEVNAKRIRWYQRQLVGNFFEKAERSVLSDSYRVHLTSLGGDVVATSSEMAVPLDRAVDAIDAMLSEAGMMGIGGRYHTSPVGIRFVRASRHLLAPQFGDPDRDAFCMIEAPLLAGKQDEDSWRIRHEILRRFRDAVAKKGGIPHWGQVNELDVARVEELYDDRWARWKKQYEKHNARGTFSNHFTRSLGLDS